MGGPVIRDSWGFRVGLGLGLGLKAGRKRSLGFALLLGKIGKEVLLVVVFTLIKVIHLWLFFLVCSCVNKHLSHLLTLRPWVKASALAMYWMFLKVLNISRFYVFSSILAQVSSDNEELFARYSG